MFVIYTLYDVVMIHTQHVLNDIGIAFKLIAVHYLRGIKQITLIFYMFIGENV